MFNAFKSPASIWYTLPLRVPPPSTHRFWSNLMTGPSQNRGHGPPLSLPNDYANDWLACIFQRFSVMLKRLKPLCHVLSWRLSCPARYIQSLDDNSLGLRTSLVYRSNTQENNLLGLMAAAIQWIHPYPLHFTSSFQRRNFMSEINE